MTDDDIISAILKREGGYVNIAADRGGPTKFGITQGTLAEWRGTPVTLSDVQTLTEDEARAIYRKRYVVDPGFDQLAAPQLRALVVDTGVNHGPVSAIKMLQMALRVNADGIIGKETLDALKSSPGVRARMVAERARAYGRLLGAEPNQYVFAAGWMNRLAEWIEALA